MQSEPIGRGSVYVPTDPEGWFDILRPGDHPNYSGGKHLLQVVTADDLTAIMNKWQADGRPEFLIDPDHNSLDPGKSSAAFGWGTGLRIVNTDNGPYLQARPRWTATGEKAVMGGEFRNASIVIDCRALPGQPDGAGKSPNDPWRIKPTGLQSVALTNAPNIKGLRFITNRRPAPEPEQPTKPTQQNKMTAEDINVMLGLPATATDAQAREAFAAISNRAKNADRAQASADLAEFRPAIPAGSDEMFITSLIANREPTLATLRAMKAAADAAAPAAGAAAVAAAAGVAAAAPVAGFHAANRQALAAAPAGTAGAVGAAAAVLTEEQKHRQQGELIASIRNTNPRATIGEALRAAKAQKPELFA